MATGTCQPFCPECQAFRKTWAQRQHNKTARAKQGRAVDVGSGGHNQPMFAHTENYRKWFLAEVFEYQAGVCWHCGTALTPSTMLLHHLDHDRTHNVRSNLEGVCKRCHQIEHECWLAFRKV